MKKSSEALLYWLVSTMCFATMCLFTFRYGVFDGVTTEVGFHQYVEPTSMRIGSFHVMPLNAAVNVGYVAVGLLWLEAARKRLKKGKFGQAEFTLFALLAWMSIVYGPVQLYRILYQTHRSAVLDQWMTLPFFAWVIVGCQSLASDEWQHSFNAYVTLLSLTSYAVSLLTLRGFELALGIHIVVTVTSALQLLRKFGNVSTSSTFIKALVSCTGFVFLKLYEHELSHWHSVFTTLSGHFLSKVCDILQLHYTFVFFKEIIRKRKYKMK